VILHTNSIRIDGGSGPNNSAIKRPTQSELLYNADLAFYVHHKDGVRIHKNRWGPTGKVSTKELVTILCRVLVEHVFDGKVKLFQVGMETRLRWAVNKIIKEG